MSLILRTNQITIGIIDLGYIDKIIPKAKDLPIGEENNNTNNEDTQNKADIDELSFFIFQFDENKIIIEDPNYIENNKTNINEVTYNISKLPENIRYISLAIYNPYSETCNIKEISPNDKICIFIKDGNEIVYKYYVFEYKNVKDDYLYLTSLIRNEENNWTIETNMATTNKEEEESNVSKE